MTRPAPWFTILYVAGIALILLAFFLLVPVGLRGETAYLDLGVLLLVYTATFPLASMRWFQVEGFSARVPILAVQGVVITLYSLVALGGMVTMALHALPFRVQATYQLVMVFLAALGFALAGLAGRQAASVAREQADLKAGLQEVRGALQMLLDALQRGGHEHGGLRTGVLRLQEDARYLSPSGGIRERGLEEDLVRELKAMAVMATAPEPHLVQEDLGKALSRCETLVRLRRQTLHRQGDSL